jgi:hypothetical protein
LFPTGTFDGILKQMSGVDVLERKLKEQKMGSKSH